MGLPNSAQPKILPKKLAPIRIRALVKGPTVIKAGLKPKISKIVYP